MHKNWESILFDANSLTSIEKDVLHKAVVFDFYQNNGGSKSFSEFYSFAPDNLSFFELKYKEAKKELVRLGICAVPEEVPQISFRS
jgi:hypothetical protein